MKKLILCISLVLFLGFVQSVFAEGNKHHFPGTFLGATHSGNSTHFTWGVEYEYKFNDSWGSGFVYEETPNANNGDGTKIRVLELFYHPAHNMRLGVGVGEEKEKGEESNTEELIRVNVNYEFHFDGFGLEPTVAVDIKDDEEAIVFGFALIKPF